MKTLVNLTLILTAITVWAWAEPREIPLNVTVLNLTADAKQTVMPDTLVATLRIEHHGKTPADVQRHINTKMQQAKELADDENGIKFITGHYHVHENWAYEKSNQYERKRRKDGWKGSQSVTLEGKDFNQVLELAGKLQGMDFAQSNLHYQLSDQARDTFQETLMAEALQNIQSRAKRFARVLDKDTTHFATINVNHQGHHPQPRMMHAKAMMAMDTAESMPTPVAAPDEMQLQATVSAQVWLK